MHKSVKYMLVFLCFVGMALVRFRESELFYDPLIAFFKSDYRNLVLPEMHSGKWMLHLAFRYVLNAGLGLLVLWLVFKDRSILTFSGYIYGAVFVVLTLVLLWLKTSSETGEYLSLFYVRRFLIQPLLIFLLLPAFFYYRKVNP